MPEQNAAVAQGLGDVDAAHAFRAVEVGERARDAQHPMIAARRQPQALGRLDEELGPGGGGVLPEQSPLPDVVTHLVVQSVAAPRHGSSPRRRRATVYSGSGAPQSGGHGYELVTINLRVLK